MEATPTLPAPLSPIGYAIPIGGGWSLLCTACAAEHNADADVVASEGTVADMAEPLYAGSRLRACVLCSESFLVAS